MAKLTLRLPIFLLIALSLLGCASLPSDRFNNICPNCQINSIEANPFQLTYLINANKQHSDIAHVYLEGDGTPWTIRNKPSNNPTSKNLLALKLFNKDPSYSLYLNRPCYGLAEMPPQCTSNLWTDGRYSKLVVETLDQALTTLKQQLKIKQFLLVGHSGGGSLAMLLAQKRKDVTGVVTIAANLDHRAWTDYFDYLPLNTSLNVAEQSPLPNTVKRWHLIGMQDQQVPPETNLPFAKNDPNAEVIIRDEYNHFCCWEEDWESFIESIGHPALR